VLTKKDAQKADQPEVLPSKPNEPAATAGCYFVGPTLLTGRRISGAKATYQGSSGWVVDVTFKGNDFATIIGANYVGKEVAIVLDGVVQSAPKINSGITGTKVQISGTFSQREAKDLALVLKYGALPVQFDQKQQTVESVSPSLGKDQLKAGIAAGLIGLGFVALYMIFFYRLLGLVVWLGLGLTGMIFFALVTYLGRTQNLTLTLAGVTGIIVSVGVTVDSYVVYFERLKDEVRTGRTIRSSLDTGFRRAFRTIVAADLVSLIGAVVLYELAVGSVRGFAYFLGISTAIDLVLAYFFMHPLVWLLSRRPSLVKLKGIGIASGLDVAQETNL
jgi:preprotein translocase subunit SecD